MYLLDIISTLITPITLLYILLFLIVFGRMYLKTYNRNRLLVFTQEEIKDRRKEISSLMEDIRSTNFQTSDSLLIRQIERISYLYNELAVGINEGLYDELYIRMVLGYEMIDFYKKYYKTIAFTPDNDGLSSRFMPLELLLKRWDKSDTPSYTFRNRRPL